MEPHGQSPSSLHEIPSYAKASEGYPPVAKSAKASMLGQMNHLATESAFIHGHSPWSSAQADKLNAVFVNFGFFLVASAMIHLLLPLAPPVSKNKVYPGRQQSTYRLLTCP